MQSKVEMIPYLQSKYKTMARANIKKWLKRVLIGSAGIFALLIMILAVHIYQVSNKPKGGVDGWQMARIDFTQSLDSTEFSFVRDVLHGLGGIHHSVANIPEGILVYAYDPQKQKASDVYMSLIKETGFKAKRFVVTESNLGGACPVIDKNSITYRISSGFQKLFN
jgi:hypothetical protein